MHPHTAATFVISRASVGGIVRHVEGVYKSDGLRGRLICTLEQA